MGECPLCGKSTHKPSTRLIKDSCGHTKCRACLLEEENGCRLCQESCKSPRVIDSIGNFDYFLPDQTTPNFESPDHTPVELNYDKIFNTFKLIEEPIVANGDCNDDVRNEADDSGNLHETKRDEQRVKEIDFNPLTNSSDNTASESQKLNNDAKDCNKIINSQLFGYKSPEFKLSDYLVFNKRLDADNYIKEIEVENDKVLKSQWNNESVGAQSSTQSQSKSESPQLNAHKSSVNVDKLYCSILEQRLTLNLKDTNSESLNKEVNCNRLIIIGDQLNKKCTDKILEQDNIDDGKKLERNDENKENKELSKQEEKETDVEDKESEGIKNLTVPKKKYNKKNVGKKSNEQVNICKEKGKRKRKILICENEVLEVAKKEPKKRSKRNRDWSHIKTLPGNPIKYECSMCKKIFKSLQSKFNHAACLIGEARFQCKICNRNFNSRSHFEYHERMHTGDKPYECSICKKKFPQKNKLNRHIEIHKQELDFECHECGKKFSSKEYLKNHLIIHQNNTFKCEFCPKTFNLKANRKRHELSHKSDRNFKCNVCPKDFTSKFLLTRHKRLHEKIRPFSCHQCNRSFVDKFELQRHMTIHSEVKPFSCKLCNIEFRRKDNFNRHVKHHHAVYPSIDVQTAGSDKDGQKKSKKGELKGKSNSELKKAATKTTTPNSKAKARKIPRSNSFSSTKSSSRLPKNAQQNSLNNFISVICNPKFERNSKVSVIKGPFPVTVLTGNSGSTDEKFTKTIPHNKALDLNRQIEERMSSQNAYCNYPALVQTIHTPISRRRGSCSGNSNSGDAAAAREQNPERSKTVQPNNECSSKMPSNNELAMSRKDINIHWRRRTAESLRPTLTKTK